ncbi:MAG: 3-hydroxyacyl-CoA dehydrogenase NAD-binding domain-containing protein [Pseudolabrys sp.]
MTEWVAMHRAGEIAVIVVDNPPVNALKHEVRLGLRAAFANANADTNVAGIVLTCAGRTFIAGADITEFDKPPQSPSLIDLNGQIENIEKPVVAAVFGTPLGGGLEITLACHFRIAAPGTRLGLPEIKLGLIPGAGGTQRLPRLVGMEKAVAMILSGDPIPAQEALALGLIDETFEGDPAAAGVAFARRVIAERRPLRRVRDIDDNLKDLRAQPDKFAELAASYVKRARGLDAPTAALESLRATLDVPIEQALEDERNKFMALRAGEQSKAQRHVFFAEREAAKVAGVGKDIKPRDVKQAAVIGAGTMGGGISMSFANAGIPVSVVETAEDALKRGFGVMEKNYKTSVSRGALCEEDVAKHMGLLTGTTDIAVVKDADLIIEAVFEEMAIKGDVFGKLDKLARPDAVLATNTSYLDVNEIAAMTSRPQSVLGMHFFSPANVMRLLEIVRGAKTAPDVLATAIAVARRIGKVPVVVGVCHGFVGNRMLRARSIESEKLLLEGALPHEVDGALTEFGFPMGPFAMGDLAGLDVGWRMRKAQGVRAEIADTLCEQGRYGQKTGKGFYLYEAGSRKGQPDPEVEQLIVATSKRLGIARRPIEKKEFIERLIYPMINEGARILEEGIAQRSGDIDVIWVYGYGFPRWRGGPMFYADTVGLAHIRDRLAALAKSSGDKRHEPAALLTELAAENGTFGVGRKKAA